MCCCSDASNVGTCLKRSLCRLLISSKFIVSGVLVSGSDLPRMRAVELRFPASFLLSVLTLRYAAQHVVRDFVYTEVALR
eukprot:s3203_g3.t1